jgi:hypothetical protein
VVLDVRDLGHSGTAVAVLERRAAADALRALTGEDFGDDPAAWRNWLRARR